MHWRKLGGRESPLRPVPVCLICTLDANPWFNHADHPNYDLSWQRMRCHGCGRPMRVDASVKFGTPRTCCDDCARATQYRQNNLRRRVKHERIVCVECGESFAPTRRDAQTCSNRCRQARHQRIRSG
jgi:hypothetical protein